MGFAVYKYQGDSSQPAKEALATGYFVFNKMIYPLRFAYTKTEGSFSGNGKDAFDTFNISGTYTGDLKLQSGPSSITFTKTYPNG